jgi:hypothetical protein
VKPTYGRVSRYGLVAFGSSLDVISVFGRTVDDAARVLARFRDTIRSTRPARECHRWRFQAAEGSARSDDRCPARYFPRDLDPAVRASCDRPVAAMRELGATMREVELPHSPYAVATYYIVRTAEAAANLARYDGVRYGPRRPGLPMCGRSIARPGQGLRRGGPAPHPDRDLCTERGILRRVLRKAQAMRARLPPTSRRVFDSEWISSSRRARPRPPSAPGKNRRPGGDVPADVFTCPGEPGRPARRERADGRDQRPARSGDRSSRRYFADEAMLSMARRIEANIDATAEVR